MKFPLLASAGTHTVDVRTNLGAFAFVLDVKDAPCTTSSFAYLVRKRFFDGTRFHRIVPGFVIQGGDPTGTRQGGPEPPRGRTDRPAGRCHGAPDSEDHRVAHDRLAVA